MSAAKGDSSNGSDDNEWSDGLHTLDAVHQLTKPKNRTDMIWTTLRVAGQPLKMEVDTGSAYSVIPHHVYKEMFQKHELQPTSVTLRTYMGELVVPEGKLRVQVKHKKQKVKNVIKGGRQVLFGRDWFWETKLDWGEIHSLKYLYFPEGCQQASSAAAGQVQVRKHGKFRDIKRCESKAHRGGRCSTEVLQATNRAICDQTVL